MPKFSRCDNWNDNSLNYLQRFNGRVIILPASVEILSIIAYIDVVVVKNIVARLLPGEICLKIVVSTLIVYYNHCKDPVWH